MIDQTNLVLGSFTHKYHRWEIMRCVTIETDGEWTVEPDVGQTTDDILEDNESVACEQPYWSVYGRAADGTADHMVDRETLMSGK